MNERVKVVKVVKVAKVVKVKECEFFKFLKTFLVPSFCLTFRHFLTPQASHIPSLLIYNFIYNLHRVFLLQNSDGNIQQIATMRPGADNF